MLSGNSSSVTMAVAMGASFGPNANCSPTASGCALRWASPLTMKDFDATRDLVDSVMVVLRFGRRGGIAADVGRVWHGAESVSRGPREFFRGAGSPAGVIVPRGACAVRGYGGARCVRRMRNAQNR